MTNSQLVYRNPSKIDADFNIPYNEFTYQKLKEGGNQIAQIHDATGQSATYDEILQKACNMAMSFTKLGIQKGDVICISSENRFEYTVCTIAAMFIGAINSALNFLYTRYELLHILNIAQPKAVICSSASVKNINDVLDEIPSIEKIIYLDDEISEITNVLFYKDLIKEHVDVDTFKVTQININDPFTIIYSSGTTGFPKGVLLTHNNAAAQNVFLKSLVKSDKTNHVILLMTPWFHSYGYFCQIALLTCHAKYVFMTRFKEEPFLKTIQNYKVTISFFAPPVLVFLAKSPLVKKFDLSSLEFLMCGGAPLSEKVQEDVMKVISSCKIIHAFGLTEATLGLICNDLNAKNGNTVGKPIIGAEIKITDINTGKMLGPNQTGEICAKGPMIMAGYYRNEKATKEAIDSDGWLHTGDIGYADEDGYFFIVDRLKELIKYKAYQVPPAELEAIVLEHPKVKDVGVVGVPDEEAGELPMAFVVKQPNVDLDEKEIIDFVASKVSNQKRLRGGVKFINEIPKNPTGKILRKHLRELLKTKNGKQ